MTTKSAVGKRALAFLRLPVTIALVLFLFMTMGGGRAFYGDLPAAEHRRRVRADQNALTAAFEAYFTDHGAYPAPRLLRDFAPEPGLLSALGADGLSSLEPGRAGGPAGLTTPVAYLAALPLDPFSGRKTRIPLLTMRRATWPLAYHRAEVEADPATAARASGWMLWSPGPDGRYDILDPARYYDPRESERRPELIDRTYDPTNGTFSAGDMVMVHTRRDVIALEGWKKK